MSHFSPRGYLSSRSRPGRTDLSSLHPSGFDAVRDPIVKAAILALGDGDEKRWFDLFSNEANSSDDGIPQDLVKWCREELFGLVRARIVAIDKVERDGLTFYARYHSDRWGDFQTFWRFEIRDGKISSLDVGATRY